MILRTFLAALLALAMLFAPAPILAMASATPHVAAPSHCGGERAPVDRKHGCDLCCVAAPLALPDADTRLDPPAEPRPIPPVRGPLPALDGITAPAELRPPRLG